MQLRVQMFVKKPVVIEAVEITEENIHDVALWCGGHVSDGNTFLLIPTLEGEMQGRLGDFIIKGVKDEFYPCKPDIFNETYEKSSEVEVVYEDQYK